jgi:Ca-activated chloride channel family protein
MGFAHPWWLTAALLVLGLAVGYLFAQRRTRRHTLRFANFELLDRIAPRRPGRWRHYPVAVILLGLLLLTIAMAGPTAQARQPRNRATVMLAVDVSLSMQATDVPPNRLAAAQAAATQFVNDLPPGINLGIVSFAGVATVQVPPTTDRAAATAAIAGLRLDQRTATGEAIILCLQSIASFARLLAGADGTAGPVPARIVMMTDGKRTVGRTEQDAAQQAADAHVPVSMIAFGTDHGSITIQGTQIPVPLDTQSMQQIVAISGGDFHTASTAEELRSVYSQLSEQIGYEITQQDVSRPWLIAGTMLTILGSGAALAVSARIP